jgi:hypothetical protein
MTAIPQAMLREFAAIADYIKAVREILQDGHMPDMLGLDRRVSALCEAIEQCDADIQQQCLPKLNELLQKLDICENDVRLSYKAMTKESSRE